MRPSLAAQIVCIQQVQAASLTENHEPITAEALELTATTAAAEATTAAGVTPALEQEAGTTTAAAAATAASTVAAAGATMAATSGGLPKASGNVVKKDGLLDGLMNAKCDEALATFGLEMQKVACSESEAKEAKESLAKVSAPNVTPEDVQSACASSCIIKIVQAGKGMQAKGGCKLQVL